jgi:hypothetical protein
VAGQLGFASTRVPCHFAQAELLGVHALLVIDTNPEEQSPATVRKHSGGGVQPEAADRAESSGRTGTFANSRTTLDIYTRAVSQQKRDANSMLVDILLPAG